MIRAVLDSNVIASGLMKPMSPPGMVLRKAVEGAFTAVISSELIAEYERALGYPRVRSRISLVDADLQSWLQLFRQHSMFVVAALLAPDFVADPDDAKVLACAIAGSAQFVMTGDRHLRVLGVFRGIEIVAPASFLGELERGD